MTHNNHPKHERNNSLLMRAVILGGLLISLPGYPAHHPEGAEKSGESIKKTVASGKIHEECALVRDGHRLQYHFTASADVEFNLHYHNAQQGRVIYLFGPSPVSSNPTDNQYAAPEPQVICLMWNNKGTDPIFLGYSFSITPI